MARTFPKQTKGFVEEKLVEEKLGLVQKVRAFEKIKMKLIKAKEAIPVVGILIEASTAREDY